MRKGQSPLIETVLIVLLTVVGISIVLSIGKPTIDRAKDAGVLNEAGQNMRVIDNLIREVASEGAGSLRTTYLKATDGEYRVNPDSGTFEFVFDTKGRLVEPGTFIKEGNLLTIGGGTGASASENSTDLILENEILKVVLKKNGNETSYVSINTSQNIRSMVIKETNTVLNPLDTAVIIENYTNTSYGTGYSKLVRSGDNLGKAEALFQINSNFTGTVYQILYTLPASSDFLVVNVKNTTRNQTTVQMIYHLGSSGTGDVIKIGGLSEQNYLNTTNQTSSLTTFNDSTSSKNVSFSAAGNNVSAWVRLDRNASVSSGRMNVSGYGSTANWWNSSWQYKKTINITNNNLTQTLEQNYTVNVTFNMTQLVEAGKMNATGNDTRIVWYNSTSGQNVELDRILEPSSAGSFDGSNDYVNVSDSPSWDFGTGDISISAWFNMTSIDANHRFILDMANSGGTDRIYIAYSSGAGGAAAQIGSNYIGSDPPSLNAWHHIVLKRQSGTVYYYLNGTLTGPTPIDSTNFDTINIFNIGERFSSASSAWPGKIDEVAIFNRSLNSTEISNLYNTRRPIDSSWFNTTGLVGLWHFDNTTSTSVRDSSGNNNHGTQTNGASYTDGYIVPNSYKNNTLWFKTQQNISANGWDANYSMYYGNPSAGSPPTNYGSHNLFSPEPSAVLGAEEENVSSYPTSPTINLGNTGVNDWSFSGELNNTNSPQNMTFNTTKLNNYLSTCTAVGGYCTIPINVTSQSAGIIQLDALNITYTINSTSTGISPVCYNSTQISKFYACSHDNSTEVDQLYTTSLIYSGTTNNFVKTCFANHTSTDYKFNITSTGELRVILPFTKGNCNTIHNKMYLVEKQEYPSVPFNTSYAIGGETTRVQMLLEYTRIKVVGTGRIGAGTHKICVEKTGEERLKAVVNVTVC